MKNKYTVLVGNLGTVHVGRNAKTASREFAAWVAISRSPHGKAAGEPVTLFRDGEPEREYAPAAGYETKARRPTALSLLHEEGMPQSPEDRALLWKQAASFVNSNT